jgi:hypothetical protein
MEDLEYFVAKVYDLNNNEHKVECYGYQHTVRYIQFMISMTKGMNPDDIILYVGTTKLDRYKTLEYYKINKDTKIKMFTECEQDSIS